MARPSSSTSSPVAKDRACRRGRCATRRTRGAPPAPRRATSSPPACRRGAARQSSRPSSSGGGGVGAALAGGGPCGPAPAAARCAPRGRCSRRCGTRSRARRAAGARGRRARAGASATLSSPSKVAARCDSEPRTLTNTFAWRRSRVMSTRRDGHEPDDARVLDVVGEEGRDLLADRLGDAVGAMMIRRHVRPVRGELRAGRRPDADRRPPRAAGRRQLCGADSSVRATSSVR